jgi:hypothetical protein
MTGESKKQNVRVAIYSIGCGIWQLLLGWAVFVFFFAFSYFEISPENDSKLPYLYHFIKTCLGFGFPFNSVTIFLFVVCGLFIRGGLHIFKDKTARASLIAAKCLYIYYGLLNILSVMFGYIWMSIGFEFPALTAIFLTICTIVVLIPILFLEKELKKL